MESTLLLVDTSLTSVAIHFNIWWNPLYSTNRGNPVKRSVQSSLLLGAILYTTRWSSLHWLAEAVYLVGEILFNSIWNLFYQFVTYAMIWYDMIWYDMIWYDMIWYDIWYDMIWYIIWYDMIWYDMIWYDMIDIQVLLSGLFRTCLQIYIVEVRQLRVLESPLERLTC